MKEIMESNKTTKEKMFLVIVIYTAVFYAAWAFIELVVYPSLLRIINNAETSEIIKEVLIKNVLWTIPAILLIKKYKANIRISLKEMFASKVNWFKLMPVFMVFAVCILGQKYLLTGTIDLNEGVSFAGSIPYLFAGITEEIVFRGWLLNAMACNRKAYLPVMINAIMFLMIHFPIWIQSGIFVDVFTSLGVISIIGLSIILSVFYLRSRNIFVPIVLHSFWDLLLYFVG